MRRTWMRRARPVGQSLGMALVLALAMIAVTSPVLAARVRLQQWETIASERYGFMIAYPGSVFTPRDATPGEDGQVLSSHDGAARLVIGAFSNDSAATMMEYRDQLLTENYSGADIDYAPVKRGWFVVSGTRGDMHFYERVSFTCGGRIINSWALLYPVSERHIYDRIVEAVARTYQPGAGRTGQCD
jgi:hypothetical protein